MSTRSHLRLPTALALLVVASALAGCGGLGPDGRFREDPIGNLEQQLIGNTLAGIGIIPRQRERIDYAARAPLAMPPRQGQSLAERPLPAPVDGDEVVASNANWPRDIDEWRRRRDAREARRPIDQQFERERDGRRMTPEELEAQRNAGPRALARSGPEEGFRERNVVMQPDELDAGWSRPTGDSIFSIDETVDVRQRDEERRQGAARSFIDERNGASGNVGGRQLQRLDTTRVAAEEPARRTITDPPAGFRAPAPDPTGGVVTEQDRAGRPLWERLFGR